MRMRTMQATRDTKFHLGQVVWHRRYNYRGVVYDVDPVFMLGDDWYNALGEDRPAKDQPWYRLLVDGLGRESYVAEQNLADSGAGLPIEHPAVERVFTGFQQGRYWPRVPCH